MYCSKLVLVVIDILKQVNVGSYLMYCSKLVLVVIDELKQVNISSFWRNRVSHCLSYFSNDFDKTTILCFLKIDHLFHSNCYRGLVAG